MYNIIMPDLAKHVVVGQLDQFLRQRLFLQREQFGPGDGSGSLNSNHELTRLHYVQCTWCIWLGGGGRQKYDEMIWMQNKITMPFGKIRWFLPFCPHPTPGELPPIVNPRVAEEEAEAHRSGIFHGSGKKRSMDATAEALEIYRFRHFLYFWIFLIGSDRRFKIFYFLRALSVEVFSKMPGERRQGKRISLGQRKWEILKQ